MIVLLLAGCLGGNGSNGGPRVDPPDPGLPDPELPELRVELVVSGLERPWGLAFLPIGDGALALVTERPGRLRLVDLVAGELLGEIGGVPSVAVVGQGGLLDVTLHPDFGPGQEWVYLTYSAAGEHGGYATHVGRGRLDLEAPGLISFEVLHVATPFRDTGSHFGSRMVFDDQWRLYVTVGDGGYRDGAQDLESHWGKTLRLEADGSIPHDNPFVDRDDALDAIYTYGHRNSQGMAVEPSTGLIWQNEHGQMNGDEINIIDQPGGNYGWPVATYSREYGTGEPIGDLPHERDDTVNPVYYWDGTEYDDAQEGFPPSGMAFYDGALLMGNLAWEYLGYFELHGREVVREHRLFRDRRWRVRDVRVHPGTGDVYLLVDAANGSVVRVSAVD
jgi:glucose/arabinose dehydrogenase